MDNTVVSSPDYTPDYTEILVAIDAVGEILKITVFLDAAMMAVMVFVVFAVAFNWRR